MKYYASKSLRKCIYQPANRFFGTVCKKSFSSFPSLATLATLGLGLTFLLWSKSNLLPTGKKPFNRNQQAPTEEKTYFEAAPRSVSGPHPSYRRYAHTGNGGIAKRSGQFAIGTAALLSIMYLFGRKK
jgi:hypothetical protein